jgi:hypothetical protein
MAVIVWCARVELKPAAAKESGPDAESGRAVQDAIARAQASRESERNV